MKIYLCKYNLKRKENNMAKPNHTQFEYNRSEFLAKLIGWTMDSTDEMNNGNRMVT